MLQSKTSTWCRMSDLNPSQTCLNFRGGSVLGCARSLFGQYASSRYMFHKYTHKTQGNHQDGGFCRHFTKVFLSACHLEHLILEKVRYCSRRGKSLDVQHEWHMFVDWKMSLGALQCLFPLEPFKYSLFRGELHHCVCLWIHTYWSANCCCLETLEICSGTAK